MSILLTEWQGCYSEAGNGMPMVGNYVLRGVMRSCGSKCDRASRPGLSHL